MGKSKKHRRNKSRSPRDNFSPRGRSRSPSNDSQYPVDTRALLKRLEVLEKRTRRSRSRSPSSSTWRTRNHRRHTRRVTLSRSRSPLQRLPVAADGRVQDRACSPSPSFTRPRNDSEIGNEVFSRLSDTCSVRNEPNDTLIIHNDETLPEEVVKILGDDPENSKENNPFLHDSLASRWRLLKYLTPANLTDLIPPKMNPEIPAVLDRYNLARDGSHVEVQNHLGKGLCALGKGIDLLLNGDTTVIKNELLEYLCDTGRILTNLFHRESVTRRNLIYPSLNKKVKEQVEICPPSSFLFGDDLGEKIKLAKNLESVTKDLKLVKPTILPATRNKSSKWWGGGSSQQRAPLQVQNLNSQRPVRRGGETRPYKGQPSKGARWTKKGQQSHPYHKQRRD
ncbi:uncharacterized protein LOC116179488 [Photinus pyralis]|uniref:uncharacterized protein LOC116179488 n=1 Tax=Photinus pyralis TaxID=7054 RepID=UPI001266F14F|nr:uncharacterized protein LOC116179488 [Photinus pyralis]